LAVPAAGTGAEDARARHAVPQLGKFLFLLAQMVALVWAMRAFQIEERAFLLVAGVATGGFAVHYWLPFRYKEPCWILVSLAGGAVLLGPVPLALLLLAGLLFFAVLSSG